MVRAAYTRPSRTGYLPSLDGWRALAIVAVLMIHDLPWQIGKYNNLSFIRYGSFGVVLFFAISGLLITTRILEEEALTGAFHLKPFYVRRLFRIQPAALVYLGVIAALMLVGVVHEHWRYWSGALLLYQNFLYRETPANNAYGFFSGHFWTLAAEEHSYLLISLLFFFVRRRRIAVFVGLLVAIKASQVLAMHHTADPLLRRTYWQIQTLLFPSVLALLLRVPGVRAAAVRWLLPIPVLTATAVGFCLCHGLVLAGLVRGRLSGLEGNLLGYSFGFWIVATVLHPESVVTRVLEFAPVRFLGRLSYSVYLWHVLFFWKVEVLTRITFPPLVFLSGRPWKYVATLGFACASYFWIEKPLIRLGHRLAPPATPGYPELRAQNDAVADIAPGYPAETSFYRLQG